MPILLAIFNRVKPMPSAYQITGGMTDCKMPANYRFDD